MSEYPDYTEGEVKRQNMSEAMIALLVALFVGIVITLVVWNHFEQAERERKAYAEGAAAFDAKVEAAGGWDRWLAGEISAGNVSAAPRGAMEVR